MLITRRDMLAANGYYTRKKWAERWKCSSLSVLLPCRSEWKWSLASSWCWLGLRWFQQKVCRCPVGFLNNKLYNHKNVYKSWPFKCIGLRMEWGQRQGFQEHLLRWFRLYFHRPFVVRSDLQTDKCTALAQRDRQHQFHPVYKRNNSSAHQSKYRFHSLLPFSRNWSMNDYITVCVGTGYFCEWYTGSVWWHQTQQNHHPRILR